VKSEEFINEAFGFGYEKPDYPGSTGRATGVLGRLASDLVGADNYAATAQALGATGRPKNAPITDLAKDTAAQIKSNPKLAARMVNAPGYTVPSAFQQQFDLIDDDPPTIQYKNSTYQRDQYGKWIDFRTGKEVPDRFVSVLDKISPPAATTPGEQLPVGATGTTPPTAPKPTAPAPTPTDQGAVWKSNRAPANAPATSTPPVQALPTTQTQAKPKLTRMPDGSIRVVDKMGKQWNKPTADDYWTNERGEIFRPGSQEHQKLSNFVQNLKESLGRKRR
jgi:hypothetical protein